MIPIPLPVNAYKEPLSSPASASHLLREKAYKALPRNSGRSHLFLIPFPVTGEEATKQHLNLPIIL